MHLHTSFFNMELTAAIIIPPGSRYYHRDSFRVPVHGGLVHMYTIVNESRLVGFANLSFKKGWENGALLALLFDFSQSVPVDIGAAFGRCAKGRHGR
jgi:hypothetical protein